MEDNINSNIIQSLWIGGQLSNVERLCIQSFIDYGHDFHLYAYEEIKNAPTGTHLFDASAILPQTEIFKFEEGWGKGSVAGFADLFRLLLLQKNGGWWADMDIVCLKALNFDTETILCSSYEGEYGSLANNCVIKSPKNSALLKYCIEYISGLGIKNMSFGEAGPFLFQKAVKELQLEDKVVPYYYFNPIRWRSAGELILGKTSTINKLKEHIRPLFKPDTMKGRKIDAGSYTVHLWNEIWRSNNFNKNGKYSPNCLFEQLKRKHNI
jgi:hypothetical protein